MTTISQQDEQNIRRLISCFVSEPDEDGNAPLYDGPLGNGAALAHEEAQNCIEMLAQYAERMQQLHELSKDVHVVQEMVRQFQQQKQTIQQQKQTIAQQDTTIGILQQATLANNQAAHRLLAAIGANNVEHVCEIVVDAETPTQNIIDACTATIARWDEVKERR